MLSKHFVLYNYPGTFFSEHSSVEISSWNVEEAKHNAPKGAFSFRFVTRSRRNDELDAKDTAHSGAYFLGGTVYTLDQVRKLPGKLNTLIRNMEGNGWDKVIKTPYGNFQPFTDEDKIV